jgi:hypothetical protein
MRRWYARDKARSAPLFGLLKAAGDYSVEVRIVAREVKETKVREGETMSSRHEVFEEKSYLPSCRKIFGAA